MVCLTLIARVTDGLPLAEGLDSDKSHNLDEYKQKAKVCAFGQELSAWG
jgi:vesicle transport protein SEC22